MRTVIAASQHGNSLAAFEDYRTLSASFPIEGYSKGYINLEKVLEFIQRSLNRENRMNSLFQDNTLIQPLDATSLADRLPGIMWVTTVVSDGFLTESFSPIGGTVIGIAITWLELFLLR